MTWYLRESFSLDSLRLNLIKTTALLTVALLLGLAVAAVAQERVDLFTPDGKRAGYAVIQGDRVDFFDKDSRRIGWGRLQPSGKVERFDLRGHRQADTALPLKVDREKRR